MSFSITRLTGTLLLFALGLTACDKEPQYSSPQKLLAQAPWRIVSDSLLRIPGVTQPVDTEDLRTNVPPCVQDNLLFFDDDGSYRQEEGPLRCNDSIPENITLGRWDYNPTKKILTLDGNGRLEWQVLQLSNTTLELFLVTTFYDATDTIERRQTRRYEHPSE